ncbi:MAG TPA: UDP-N-acetylmuramoyl-L-alanine--D-glutamate ligase [Turneriella sp.]|nr:UDP-N-acetylmuramoyl-L-alanine--D-glutamate ligase [Turneriella sp.]
MQNHVLLLGAGGKTGASYARLLQEHGHHVLWYDKNSNATPQGLTPSLTTHIPHDALDFTRLKNNFSVLTLTPGVPLSHPFIQEARNAGKKIISEVAYVAPYLINHTILGVTGTDGKSTTTTLTAQLLRALGHDAIECGNFGIPLSQIILEGEKYKKTILVCELSSYQLEEPGDLKLNAGIFLNLAPDHLNRYASIEEYGLAKWNIASCLKKDAPLILVKNLTVGFTPYWKNAHPLNHFTQPLLLVDTERLHAPHFHIEKDTLVFSSGEKSLTLDTLKIQGRHNWGNLLFALEATQSVLKNPSVQFSPAIQTLNPLPHRFEIIPQTAFPQITFINDSKATTTQAALTALQNVKDTLFIFLGGQAKGERYHKLGERLKELEAHACIYGACQKEMAADFESVSFTTFTLHENLFKAFHAAKRMVIQQQISRATLLLAPAVTSWDQFASFEERGDYFRELVAALE